MPTHEPASPATFPKLDDRTEWVGLFVCPNTSNVQLCRIKPLKEQPGYHGVRIIDVHSGVEFFTKRGIIRSHVEFFLSSREIDATRMVWKTLPLSILRRAKWKGASSAK